MRVLVTGATGYIGFNVAQAFRRHGHEVWGLVRSRDKANEYLRCELVVCSPLVELRILTSAVRLGP